MVHRLRFVLSAGEVVPGGSLAAPLAPFGLELPRLARELNARTLALYVPKTPVSVRIKVGPGRQWHIEVLPPPLSLLLRSIEKLSVRQLYGLVLLVSTLSGRPPRSVAATTFGTLRSLSSPNVHP